MPTFQEAMDKSLKEAADGESESSDSSSESDCSSESSTVGLAKAKKGKAASKAKAKARPARTDKGKDVETPPVAEAMPASAASQADIAKSEKSIGSSVTEKVTPTALLDKANASLKSLKEVTPWLMCSHQIKGKDVEQRMAKALELSSKCEALGGNHVAVKDVGVQLGDEVNRLSMDESLLSALASSEM